MFKVVAPTFKHTVRVFVPVDGGHSEETISATYRVLKASEVKDFNVGTPEGSKAFLTRAIVKLDDLQNGAGAALAYSDEVLEQVLDLPYARAALAQGYFEAVSKAKAGN